MPTDARQLDADNVADDANADGALSEAAELLVAHARREDAITLVAEAVAVSGGRIGLLLLARLKLESGTRRGAVGAGAALLQWRRRKPYDLDAIVLLRAVLQRLGRVSAVSSLDRDLRWTFGAVPRSSQNRRARAQEKRRTAIGVPALALELTRPTISDGAKEAPVMKTAAKWHGHEHWLVLPVGDQATRGGMYCNDCGHKLVEDDSIEEGTAKRDGNVTRIHPVTAQDLDTLRQDFRDQLPTCA